MKFSILALLSIATAAPVTVTRIVDASPTGYDWQADWVQTFPIANSCNATQFNQLAAGLQEAQTLAEHARDHTLRYGYKSPFYRKYFGNESSTAEVAGHFQNIVSADKSDTLFHCDDLDEKCSNDGWAGYWRGENGTDETVICDLSFTSRRYLSQMCANGYTVSQSPTNTHWASDLLHRFFHLESIGNEIVGHYVDSYEDCLEFATENATYAVRNSDSLIYYALDVYAYDVAAPGEGCSGDNTTYTASDFATKEVGVIEHDHDHDDEEDHDHDHDEEDEHDHDHDHDDEDDHDHDHDTPSTTSGDAATNTADAASHCHTHADGEVHC
ncbi:pH-regulated antigen PRA1 [Candida viswanathii]|uniref:pH-regulated antigen PRA1 n=1 Tax=Candida viswanathii TaxID=5486 RepID=A0A367XSD9_9ASCO|nr:pH-regulated antigen PRA1 [Candida viswanathii]